MSKPQYFAPKGVGELLNKEYGYNQAVRLGDRIELSGQGGWSTELKDGSIDIPEDHAQQIDNAFANCEAMLKAAGGKGFSQVYRVNSYHVPLDDVALGAMERNFKKWMPDHQPIWTCVAVPRLALEVMMVEIEVWAHDPMGAGGS